jgi:hypothetical protein
MAKEDEIPEKEFDIEEDYLALDKIFKEPDDKPKFDIETDYLGLDVLFNELEEGITTNVVVADCDAVLASLEDLKYSMIKHTDVWKEVDYGDLYDVFTTLNTSIHVFVNKSANTADYISAALKITTAFVKAIPGSKIITEPIAFLMKLAGSICGAFGSIPSKANRYMAALNADIKEQIDDARSKELNGKLTAKLKEMKVDYNTIAGLLAETYTNPQEELKYMGYTVSTFQKVADDEITETYKFLNDQLALTSSKDWRLGAAVAENFYKIAEVVNMKTVHMQMGVFYFQLLEMQTGKYNNSLALQRSLVDFRLAAYNASLPYFSRPTLQGAAFTHWIYRLSPVKFSTIVGVYNTLQAGQRPSKWPEDAATYHFNCREASYHNPSLGACNCVRLTTLFSYHDNKYLTIPSDHQDVQLNKFTDTPHKTASFKKRENELKQKDDKTLSTKTDRSHFELYNDGYPGQAPYYRWYAASRNKYEEHQTIPADETHFPQNAWKDFAVRMENFYIFEVFPTADEKKNKNPDSGKKIFPNNWSLDIDKIPDANKRFLMMGYADDDRVWCDHKAESFDQKPFQEIVYDNYHYGSPDHCLWIMLDDTQLLGDKNLPNGYK